MSGQGSRVFKAMGKAPPGPPKLRSSQGKSSQRVTTANDDSDSLSSYTPSEDQLVCPEWRKAMKRKQLDANNNNPRNIIKKVKTSASTVQPLPVTKQAIIGSAEKVNHWLDREINTSTNSSQRSQSQLSEGPTVSKANSSAKVAEPSVNSDSTNVSTAPGPVELTATPTSNQSCAVQNSSGIMAIPPANSSTKAAAPKSGNSDSTNVSTAPGPVELTATPTSNQSCAVQNSSGIMAIPPANSSTKAAAPKSGNSDSTNVSTAPGPVELTATPTSNQSCAVQNSSGRMMKLPANSTAKRAATKSGHSDSTNGSRACDTPRRSPRIASQKQGIGSNSSTKSNCGENAANTDNPRKFRRHLVQDTNMIVLSLSPDACQGLIISPMEIPAQPLHEDFITPSEESNANPIPILLKRNQPTQQTPSRFNVRKNLFPTDDNLDIIIDANETLESTIDRLGGSISLLVDAHTKELVPENFQVIDEFNPEESVAEIAIDGIDIAAESVTESIIEGIDIAAEESVTENNIGKKRKRTVEISEKTPPKKRRVNREEWKSVKTRVAAQSGKEHVSTRGKERRSKTLQPPCGAKCRKKCTSRISEELRSKLLTKYWGLGKKSSQWMFLTKLIKTVKIKRRKVEVDDEDDAFRKHSYEYHLCDPDEKLPMLIPVCQTMFLSTFDISITVVKTSLVKNSPDKRGKKGHESRRLPEALVNSVKDHVKKFPLVPSHYCRADSRRKYLDENLSVAQMHRMYLLERGEGTPDTATLRQYRDIFNTCFNLSFFHPKKDQCSLCLEYDSPSPSVERSDEQIRKYNEHQQEKTRIRELKKADKLASRDKELSASSGNNIRTVTYDLQKVLYCPKAENAELFYRRKLSCFNFTLYDCTEKQAYNYFWDLTVGKKGSNEISTFVLDYIDKMVKKSVNDFRFYSDSCPGQNKNQYLFSMYYWAAMKYDIKITHRWLVKGHTQMECDSVHARIEKKTRNTPMYTPQQWFGKIATAKVKKPAYMVEKVKTESILSFRELEKSFKWDKVPITQLREICFDPKTPGFVSYRKKCDGEVTKFDILVKRRGRPINWATFNWKQAYSTQPTIKPKVLNDLKWYVNNGLIPDAHLDYYNSLFEPVPPQAVVAAAENDNNSDDEDDTPQEVVRENNDVNLVQHNEDEENENEIDDPPLLGVENAQPENNDDDTDSDG